MIDTQNIKSKAALDEEEVLRRKLLDVVLSLKVISSAKRWEVYLEALENVDYDKLRETQ